jgi:excisionase family DNA binding protein
MKRTTFSIDEAARRLHVHANTVRRALLAGRLEARLVSGKYAIGREDLDRFVAGQTRVDALADPRLLATIEQVVEMAIRRHITTGGQR